MFEEWKEYKTINGNVYIIAFPKENYREKIFSFLSKALNTKVDASLLKCKENSSRPEFPGLFIDVNWTHSKDVCVCAYSKDCGVGIDLEFLSPKKLSLADRFFSIEESSKIHQIKETDFALQLFFKLWTKKEAYYKCKGGNFFEGVLKKNMLKNIVDDVALYHLEPKEYGIEKECILTLATMAKANS